MFERKLLNNVKEDERVVLIVRRYWVTMLLPIFASTLCIIAPFFFLVPLFRLGSRGVGGFIFLLVLGIFLFVRTLYVYSLNAFILTDQRVIDVDQRGLFHRMVSECLYRNVQDVSIRVSGIGQTLFHFGSIVIQTSGASPNVELDGVKSPERVQEAVSRLIEESKEDAQTTDGEMSATELLHLAEKMKEGLTPDQFRTLLGKKRKER